MFSPIFLFATLKKYYFCIGRFKQNNVNKKKLCDLEQRVYPLLLLEVDFF